MTPKFFRTPKDGELIEHDCGCIYRVKSLGGKRFEIESETFCIDHDPTLTEYAKEHDDEIASATA